jgi:hypothetical protein
MVSEQCCRGDRGVWHLRCTLRGRRWGHGIDAGRRLAVGCRRHFPLPQPLSRPGPRHGSPRVGTTMLSVVIALLTMVAMAGGVLRLRQMRRNRDVNELLLQLRTRDALLGDPGARAPETTRDPDAPSRAADMEDVLASSGPAVPLPQGANRWRSSPEGGLG